MRPITPFVVGFLLAFTFNHSLNAQLTINEIAAINGPDGSSNGGLQDEDDQFSDWIEIYNDSDEAISLTGYALTDDPENLAQWKFGNSANVPAKGYYVVFASGKNRNGLFATTQHTNFKLASEGEYLALVDPEGTILDEFEDGFPEQFSNVSYSRGGYMVPPTPGEVNKTVLGKPEADVFFSVSTRTFSDEITVQLSAPDLPEGAEIRYTLDGRIPDKSLFSPATLYTEPIVLDDTAQIRARVFQDGKLPSRVVSETFVKLDDEVKEFSSNLPVIIIENYNGRRPPTTSFVPASMIILEPEETGSGEKRTRLDQMPSLTTRAGVRVRGSSTAGNPKMSLAVETWHDDLDLADKEIEPFGMPANSDWVLSGRYTFDRALMRNPFIYEVFRQMGNYAIRTRFVEVYIDVDGGGLTNSDYYGVYTFMEKIKRGPDRVDVHDATPADDLSGGYMLKVDRTSVVGDERHFSAGGESSIVWVDPDQSVVTTAQENWIRGYLNEMRDAMVSEDPEHPETGYRNYIDTASWIDEHMIRLLTKDPDGLRLSTYFYKPRNGKIHYGPVWDFDRTMGCDSDTRALTPTGWNPSTGINYFTYTWWNNLLGSSAMSGGQAKVPEFWQEWIDRWHQVRRNQLSVENINAIIDSMAGEIREGQERNFNRWSGVRPDSGDAKEFNDGLTGWEGEVEHLKGWLKARVEWIDDQFVAPPSFEPAGGLVDAGTEVTVNTGGSIFAPQTAYVMTNRADPRIVGGSVDPEAVALEPKVTIDKTVTYFARAQKGEGFWSGPSYYAFVVDGISASAENLLFSEVMYHPLDGDEGEQAEGFYSEDLFEYVELANAGDRTMYLGDVQFTNGITFDFKESPIQTLAPGERVLVVSDREAFAKRYGNSLPVAGVYIGKLSNSGERLALSREGELVQELDYSDDDPWPADADGGGASLSLKEVVSGADLATAANWAAEPEGGSPGKDSTSVGMTFEVWAASVFSAEELIDESVSGLLADADGDGLENLLEYALGLDPKDGLSTLAMQIEREGNTLIVKVTRRADAFTAMRLESGGDLSEWVALEGEESVAPLSEGLEEVTFTETVAENADELYLRLRVEIP